MSFPFIRKIGLGTCDETHYSKKGDRDREVAPTEKRRSGRRTHGVPLLILTDFNGVGGIGLIEFRLTSKGEMDKINRIQNLMRR